MNTVCGSGSSRSANYGRLPLPLTGAMPPDSVTHLFAVPAPAAMNL